MVFSPQNYHASIYSVVYKECCLEITLVFLLSHCILKFYLKHFRSIARGIT
jgi:hypothetical protein